MSGSMAHLSKDLYRLLRLPRSASHVEIKKSYREIALALHPDRHDGCSVKTAEFREVSEAYRILSDRGRRSEYDRHLDGSSFGADGKVGKRSRAAERNPFYRKVYSPAAPPGMKTFDPQRHYDMHYGQGMMNEEIERARKRAEAASPRRNGSSYRSPLGAGFGFDKERPKKEQTNPFARGGEHRKQDDTPGGGPGDGGFRIQYEEASFDMDGCDLMEAKMRGKEYVVERMKHRRRNRVRERGDPNPHRRHEEANNSGEAGCVIM